MSPVFHVSLLKFMHYSSLHLLTTLSSPPPLLEVIRFPTYTMWALLDSRWQKHHLQYLICQEGCGPEEQSWISTAGILDPSLTVDFHCMDPDCPADVLILGTWSFSSVLHIRHLQALLDIFRLLAFHDPVSFREPVSPPM